MRRILPMALAMLWPHLSFANRHMSAAVSPLEGIQGAITNLSALNQRVNLTVTFHGGTLALFNNGAFGYDYFTCSGSPVTTCTTKTAYQDIPAGEMRTFSVQTLPVTSTSNQGILMTFDVSEGASGGDRGAVQVSAYAMGGSGGYGQTYNIMVNGGRPF